MRSEDQFYKNLFKMKPSIAQCAFLQVTKSTLIEVIHKAKSLNLEPMFYHPLYLQIDDLIKQGRKKRHFILNCYTENEFWNTCQDIIKNEKTKYAHLTTTKSIDNTKSTEDRRLINKAQEELVFSALDDLVIRIRNDIFSSNPAAIMSESIQAKKSFLAHCYFVSSPMHNQQMFKLWEKLLAPRSPNEHHISTQNAKGLQKGVCFFCNKKIDSIQIHMESVHSVVKERCNQCGKLFKNKTTFTRHSKTLHRSQQAETEQSDSEKLANVQKDVEADMISYIEFQHGYKFITDYLDKMEDECDTFLDQVVPTKKRKTN